MIKIILSLSILILNYSYAESNQWETYYQNTLNASNPHLTLSLSQKYFKLENREPGIALDLGAGTGRDTLFLLNSGWDVVALDAEPLSIEIILSRVEAKHLAHLEVIVSPFSEIENREYDLINASYSLPFCKPQDFEMCWSKIVSNLAVGGRFCGQFFGVHDEWATNPELTILTQDEVIQLFENEFEIEYLQIDDGLIPCANGKMKHLHVYHVIAKKKEPICCP